MSAIFALIVSVIFALYIYIYMCMCVCVCVCVYKASGRPIMLYMNFLPLTSPGAELDRSVSYLQHIGECVYLRVCLGVGWVGVGFRTAIFRHHCWCVDKEPFLHTGSYEILTWEPLPEYTWSMFRHSFDLITFGDCGADSTSDIDKGLRIIMHLYCLFIYLLCGWSKPCI